MASDLSWAVARPRWLTSAKRGLFYIFPLLVVFGNMELWLAGSSITLPVALLPVAILCVCDLCSPRRLYFSWRALLFFSLSCAILLAGLISSLAVDWVSLKRNLVSLLPIIGMLAVQYAFRDVSVPLSVRRPLLMAALVLSLSIIACSLWKLLPILLVAGWAEMMASKGEIATALGGSNLLAVFIVFFVPFAWVHARWIWAGLLVALLVTLSKFGLFFFMLATVITVLSRRDSFYYLLGLVGLGMLLVWLLLMCLPVEYLQHMDAVPGLGSLVARINLWRLGWELLDANFLYGWGPGGFTSYQELMLWTRAEWGVHNFILARWIEFGLLGLVIYIVMILFAFHWVSQLLPAEDRLLKVSLFVTLLYALFENVIGVAAFEMLFAYGLCLMAARRSSAYEE